MEVSPLDNSPPNRWHRSLLIFGLLFVIYGASMVALHERQPPTKKEFIETWEKLRNGKSPNPVIAFLETKGLLIRSGNSRYNQLWKHCEEMLEFPETALLAADFLDRSPLPAPGVQSVETWQSIQNGIEELIEGEDAVMIRSAFSLPSTFGGSSFSAIISRSAVKSRNDAAIDELIQSLESLEAQMGLPPEFSDPISYHYSFYRLPPIELGSMLVMDPRSGSIDDNFLREVMKERSLTVASVIQDFLKSLTLEFFSEESSQLLAANLKPTSSLKLESRIWVTEWLLNDPAAMSFRHKYPGSIVNSLEEIHGIYPLEAKKLFVDAITSWEGLSPYDPAVFETTGLELFRWANGKEPGTNWFDSKFSKKLIATLFNHEKEEIIGEALIMCGDDLNYSFSWFLRAIQSRHDNAAFALLNAHGDRFSPTPHRGQWPRFSDTETHLSRSEVDTFLDRAPNQQTRAYADFVVSSFDYRFERINSRQKGNSFEKAKANYATAIENLSVFQSPDEPLLEHALWCVFSHDLLDFQKQVYPLFETWSEGRSSPNELIDLVANGQWKPDHKEKAIWKNYFRILLRSNEIPLLPHLLLEIATQNSKSSEAENLGELVGINGWSKNYFQKGWAELVGWTLGKRLEHEDPVEALKWLNELVSHFHVHHLDQSYHDLVTRVFEFTSFNTKISPRVRLKVLVLLADQIEYPSLGWPENIQPFCDSFKEIPAVEFVSTVEQYLTVSPIRESLAPHLLSKHPVCNSRNQKFLEEHINTDWMKNVLPSVLDTSYITDRNFAGEASPMSHVMKHFFFSHYSRVIREKNNGSTPSTLERVRGWVLKEYLREVRQGTNPNGFLYREALVDTLDLPAEAEHFDQLHLLLQELEKLDLNHMSDLGATSERALFSEARHLLRKKLTNRNLHLIAEDENIRGEARAWILAGEREFESAYELFSANLNELNFRGPHLYGSKTNPLPNYRDFRKKIDDNSDLARYVDLYIANSDIYRRTKKSPGGYNQTYWENDKYQRRLLSSVAKEIDQHCFESENLEFSILKKAVQLGSVNHLLPKKITKWMNQKKSDRSFYSKLEGAELEIALLKRDYEVLDQFVEVGENVSRSNSRSHIALSALLKHFWRLALTNSKFTDRERELIRAIAINPDSVSFFNSNPLILRQLTSTTRTDDTLCYRFKVLYFSLRLLKKLRNESLDLDWYASEFAITAMLPNNYLDRFLSDTALLMAARSQSWSTKERWNLIHIVGSKEFARIGFRTRIGLEPICLAGFLSFEEFKEGINDFAIQHPQNGWVFYHAAKVSIRYHDNKSFNWAMRQSKEFTKNNQQLARALASLKLVDAEL